MLFYSLFYQSKAWMVLGGNMTLGKSAFDDLFFPQATGM